MFIYSKNQFVSMINVMINNLITNRRYIPDYSTPDPSIIVRMQNVFESTIGAFSCRKIDDDVYAIGGMAEVWETKLTVGGTQRMLIEIGIIEMRSLGHFVHGIEDFSGLANFAWSCRN